MGKNWVSPGTITGDAATGKRYLRRVHINEEFWREVEKGNHILFVAPRRVGKTSIMKDLAINPLEGFSCIYQNIESVKTRNEFFQRLFELILQCIERSPAKKAKDLASKWFKSIEEISTSRIKFREKEVDYERELKNVISELGTLGTHTIIFLDEFSEVIHKLNKQGHQQDAIDILHTLREIRSVDDFKKFTIVYAGSVGLQFVIKSIDRPKLINDLHPIETGPLSPEETIALTKQLTDGATIQFSDDAIVHLSDRVKHLLPYYIQLMIQEIDIIGRQANNPQVSFETIDRAFEQLVKKNKNFEDWLSRLKDYQPEHFPFINEILKKCAHDESITVQEIYNLALDTQYNRKEDYMDFVDELMNDGYLIETERNTYRFISPFLQQFWLRKYPL